MTSPIRFVYRMLNPTVTRLSFRDSKQYWQDRYKLGYNSGAGSYNRLAEFKAEVINGFVEENSIHSVMEFGCGDGNQLKLANYPIYVGWDVSPDAVTLCRSIFRPDDTKKFGVVDDYNGETAELTLSLDVVYHLIEDTVFHKYMSHLFSSAEKYVIVYSSNIDSQIYHKAFHIKYRRFTDWIDENCPNWSLLKHIPNRYPYNCNNGYSAETSFAEFYIYHQNYFMEL